MRKVYEEVPVEEELPPIDDVDYVVRYSGNGSWYTDEVSSLTGKEINGSYTEMGMLKSWFKQIN